MITLQPRTNDHAELPASAVRGVLFDVDGTLYRQAPLRALMAAELAVEGLRRRSLVEGMRLARTVATFRAVREDLRAVGEPSAHLLANLQFTRAADRLGVGEEGVREVIAEWMMERPLKYLRPLVPSGLPPLLSALAARQVRLGVLSDYPAAPKLQAMGIADRFSLSLSTVDPSINAFKPHPKGFLRACDVWGLSPQEVLYVGDRPDIDGTGAAAAGMRSFLLAGRHAAGTGGSLDDLRRLLDV